MPREWTIKQHIDAGHYPVQGQVPLRDGGTAMIYTTDHPHPERMIVGGYEVEGRWYVATWYATGRRSNDPAGAEIEIDILPPPPRKRRIEAWATWAPGWTHPVCFASEANARQAAAGSTAQVVSLTAEVDEPWPEPTEDAAGR